MSDENVFEKAIDEVKTLVHDAEAKIESIVHPTANSPVAPIVATPEIPTVSTLDASAVTGAAVEGAVSETPDGPIEQEVATIKTAVKETPETLLKQMLLEFEGITAMGKSEIESTVSRFRAAYAKL